MAFGLESKKHKIQEEFLRGLKLIRNGQLKGAVVAMKRAYQGAPEIAFPMFVKQFKKYQDEELLDEAILMGKLILESEPRDLRLINLLGDLTRKLRYFDKAEFYYEQAREYFPQDRQSKFNLAACQERINLYGKDLEKILIDYGSFEEFIVPEKIETKNPKYIDEINVILIDRLKIHKNERLQVLMLRQELLELGGQEKEAKAISALIQKEGNIKLPNRLDPKEIQKLILQIYHNRWKYISKNELEKLEIPIFNLGQEAFYGGNFSIAKECFEKLMAMKSQLTHIELFWAMASWKLSEKVEAIMMLQKIQAKHPNDRYISTNLGIAFQKDGNMAQAYKYLLRGATTLKRLAGEYNCSKIIELAEENYQKGKFKKSLFLYRTIAEESQSAQTWMLIGNLEIEINQPEKAINSFKNARLLNPAITNIDESLKLVHDRFVEAGEAGFQQGRYVKAAECFEYAMKAHRGIETIKRAAEIYRFLRKNERAKELMIEFEEILEKRKYEKIDRARDKQMLTGKKLMKEKKYDSAIHYFEDAFQIQPDKDVLMLLAHMYKGLNRPMALKDLMGRWKQHQAYKEKQKKYATLG